MRVTRKRRPPATPKPGFVPMVWFGRPLFAPRDEVDGTVVNGVGLIRTSDGSLVAVVEQKR